MSIELYDFIRRALSKGMKRPEIANVLKQAGWTDISIKAGLSLFADVDSPVPVPRPQPYISAREVFLYLVMFSALYCVCFHVGDLLFDLVNLNFPDVARDPRYDYTRNGYNDSIRWSISALVISLPVFFYTFRLINRAIEKDPSRRNSWPRKWLTYATLFFATMALMSDGGALVYNVLAGEITIRFIFKVLAIAIIAGGNFMYFLHDMRQEEAK